jgi:isopenicillin-N N-acyltransferase-like protein
MLPLVVLSGSPHQQGLAHGQAARDRIRHNLAVYFDRFQSEAQLNPAEVRARAERYWPVIQAADADYAQALEGVAEGSGEALVDLVALNVRYEILYHQFTAIALADGCSAFALLSERTANGHLVMGQNWDWIPEVQGIVLQTVGEPVDTLAFTEAGIVGGKLGLNSAGLGLAINGLMSADDDWTRLGTPFHVRCHQILRSRSVAEAEAIALAEPRSCSANYLLAQAPGTIVDVETAPDAACRLLPTGGLAIHTNHFMDPAGLGVVEPREESIPRSRHRYKRVSELFGGTAQLTVDDIQGHLRDHVGYPGQSVCRHPDPARVPAERYATVVSAVMDLDDGSLWLSDGPPCTNPYQTFALRPSAA